MRRVLPFVVCASIAVSAYAQYDCAVPKYASTLTGGTIALQDSSGASGSMIDAAISYWNDSCFGEGVAFPLMCAGCSGPNAYPVTVQYVDGAGPRCGVHTAHLVNDQPFASTIMIYASAGGYSCAPTSDALAHELGHVLGLTDLSYAGHCYGSIMGARAPGGTRTVTSEDCSEVDKIWRTPAEQQQQESCELQCNVACTLTSAGYTCPATGDGGTGDGGNPGCTWGACSPLVLDLNGDGIHTTDVETDPVAFDLTGDGRLDLVGWTHPSTEEGLLYYDHNHNRVIDGGAELFGEVTMLPDGRRAQNGFEALAAYDDPAHGGNGDGVISSADRVWGRIRLWVDRNHDGLMTNDENYSLGEVKVVQLDLGYEQAAGGEQYGLDVAGNYHFYSGSFVQQIRGREILRALHDIYFAVVPRGLVAE